MTILKIFRLAGVIKRVVLAVLVIIFILVVGSPGCNGDKNSRSSGSTDIGAHEFYQGTAQKKGGAVPCIDASTGMGNPLSYMDVADTGWGNINSGRFGNTRSNGERFHGGIDLDAEVGTPAYSIGDGEVISVYSDARWDGTMKYEDDGGGYGNNVRVRTYIDNKEVIILYAHLDVNGVDVKPGQTVQAGTQLGRTGRTGNAYNVTNPHLHFEVRDAKTQKAINPEPFLNGKVSESGAFVDVACDNRDQNSTIMWPNHNTDYLYWKGENDSSSN